MWEKDAKLGWKMVEQSRKDVPDQKASMAVPLSFRATICMELDQSMNSPTHGFQEPTGNATDNDVPSRATIKVMTARVRKAT